MLPRRKLTTVDCLSGVVYHPKDESIALMLNDSAASINRTLIYTRRLSIYIISIKANSSKDLLLIGNYFPFLISQSVSPSVRQSVLPSLGQSVSQSVSHSVRPSVRPSVSQSVGQSVRPSFSQSVSQSVCPSLRPSVRQ